MILPCETFDREYFHLELPVRGAAFSGPQHRDFQDLAVSQHYDTKFKAPVGDS